MLFSASAIIDSQWWVQSRRTLYKPVFMVKSHRLNSKLLQCYFTLNTSLTNYRSTIT